MFSKVSGTNTSQPVHTQDTKNVERDKQLRLDRTSEGTRITLDQFAGIDGRVENPPQGKGKDSVTEKRKSVGDYFSGIVANAKSLLGKIQDFFSAIGKKDTAADSGKLEKTKTETLEQSLSVGLDETMAPEELDPAKKDHKIADKEFNQLTSGNRKVSEKGLGLVLALAVDSGSKDNMRLAVKKAIEFGVEQHKLNPESVQTDGFKINLQGGKSGLANRQLSDEGLESLKDIALGMLEDADEVEAMFINQFVDSPPMSETVAKSFMVHVQKDKQSNFLRGNSTFTTELAIGVQKSVHVDLAGIVSKLLESEDGVKLLQLIDETNALCKAKDQELETLTKNTKDKTAPKFREESMRIQNEKGEIELRIKGTPSSHEVAQLVSNLVSNLIESLLGDKPTSVLHNTDKDFSETLASLSKEISEAPGLQVDERKKKIDGLYQNAIALRGLCPKVIDLISVPEFGGAKNTAIVMLGQVFQMAANNTLTNGTKPQSIKDTCADLSLKFQNAMENLVNSFNEEKI